MNHIDKLIQEHRDNELKERIDRAFAHSLKLECENPCEGARILHQASISAAMDMCAGLATKPITLGYTGEWRSWHE